MGDNFFNNFFGHTGGSPFNRPPFNGQFPGSRHPGRNNTTKQNNSNKPVSNSRLYDILGIKKDANDKAIRKAYLKRSTAGEYRHPDKGGDEENFKKLSQAYEILKDPEKKKEYDTYGEDIFDSDFAQKKAFRSNFGNPFGNPFGFHHTSSHSSNKREVKKGPPTTFPFKLTLEELCKNTTKRIKITRKVVFEKPSDKNNNTYTRIPDDKLETVWATCKECNGQGMIKRINQIRPGMIQQIQMQCQTCGTTGYNISDAHEIREATEIVEIFIEKGTTPGTKLKYRNKGNVAPGRIPGDLCIVVEEKPHDIYTRKENDLLIKKEITIDEALYGRHFYLKHPDGRVLDIDMQGVVTPKDNLRCIEGCGMPIKGDTVCGKLFIYFIITFPTSDQLNIHSTMKQKLRDILTSIPQYKSIVHKNDFSPDKDELEESQPVSMISVNMDDFGHRRREHKSAHDSDDEDEMHHDGPTQCHQM